MPLKFYENVAAGDIIVTSKCFWYCEVALHILIGDDKLLIGYINLKVYEQIAKGICGWNFDAEHYE